MNIHGVELLDADDMVIRHQARTGYPFEADSMAAWCEACAQGTAVDVGAYTGLYAIAAAQAGTRSIAFEPNREVYARLLENVAANGVEVECHQAAASNVSGSARFIGRLGVRLTSAGRIEPGAGVATVRIDALCLADVSAIKIDVEGHECAVIEGARDTIVRCSPLIITEALGKRPLGEQVCILEGLGYRPTLADEHNVIWHR